MSSVVNQNIALLKRLRTLLLQQREKFCNYLHVLDKQEEAISSNNSSALEVHVTLEQQVFREIISLQKVIVPLDKMYRNLDAPNSDIHNLQDGLEQIKRRVLEQNTKNRNLLIQHRDAIRQKINNLKLPKSAQSIYSKSPTTQFVDLSV